MISLVQIGLGQEGSSGSFRGTSLFGLSNRKVVVGIVEVGDDLLPSLVVRIFGVGDVLDVIFLQAGLVDERNLLEQALQLEVAIGTQEQHLGRTLLNGRIVLVGSGQHTQAEINA